MMAIFLWPALMRCSTASREAALVVDAHLIEALGPGEWAVEDREIRLLPFQRFHGRPVRSDRAEEDAAAAVGKEGVDFLLFLVRVFVRVADEERYPFLCRVFFGSFDQADIEGVGELGHADSDKVRGEAPHAPGEEVGAVVVFFGDPFDEFPSLSAYPSLVLRARDTVLTRDS